MLYTEAKEKISAILDEAKAKLDALGITVSPEVELIENKLSETESEPLLIMGALALTAEGLTEDDTYYISIDARIEDGEVDGAAIDEALPKFTARVHEAFERLNAAEDKTATLLEMGREVDEELERLYEAELERERMLRQRDLKTAFIGVGLIVVAAILALIIKAII